MNAPGPSAALTVLGAGTLVPHALRTSSSHYLEAGQARVLLDCGAGTLHGLARHGVPWPELSHVALSHWHNDHIGDLPALLLALERGSPVPRRAPLTLLGPTGLGDLLARLAGAFGDHVLDPGFEIRVVELDAGGAFEDAALGVRIACVSTPHTAESLAYRVEGAWGALGYTGDSGPSAEVADFLGGVDALVAECNEPDHRATGRHLTPESLAMLAERARPGLVVVVHVGPLHTPEEAVRRIGARYRGRVVAAENGLRVRLQPGAAAVDPLSDRR